MSNEKEKKPVSSRSIDTASLALAVSVDSYLRVPHHMVVIIVFLLVSK